MMCLSAHCESIGSRFPIYCQNIGYLYIQYVSNILPIGYIFARRTLINILISRGAL